MKIYGLLLCCLVTITTYAQPQKFKIHPLEGYYLGEKIELEKGLNFMVISNEKEFIKYFGDIDKRDKPNFDFDHVIVIARRPTKKQYFLSLDSMAVKAGNFIEVYYKEATKKHTLTYLDHPIVVASIPKYFSVTKINFYNREHKKEMTTVRIR